MLVKECVACRKRHIPSSPLFLLIINILLIFKSRGEEIKWRLPTTGLSIVNASFGRSRFVGSVVPRSEKIEGFRALRQTYFSERRRNGLLLYPCAFTHPDKLGWIPAKERTLEYGRLSEEE